MRRTTRSLRVAIAVAAVAALVAACGAPSSGPTASPGTPASGAGNAGATAPTAAASALSGGGETQSNEAGGITVTATWGGPMAGASFEVAMDNHVVSLDSIDLHDAVLRNDRGETLMTSGWAAPSGGHHRAGVLAFGGDANAFFSGARWVELVLAEIGDAPERTLRWDLNA